MSLGLIANAISGLIGAISNGYSRYQERKQAEHDVIIAIERAKQELALKTVEAELNLGRAQIQATSSWFKHLTFVLWFGPFIITTFFPEYGKMIFTNWATMPEWYAQSCVAIMFFIWGVQVGKGYISGIFKGASSFFAESRKISFQKRLFYDTLRSTKGNITQAEVDLYEKALNAAGGNKDETTHNST